MVKSNKFLKRFPLYIILILLCLIIISPLLIVLSSSLRMPGNMKSPLVLFRPCLKNKSCTKG